MWHTVCDPFLRSVGFLGRPVMTVSVQNGMARLTGTVDTWSERRAATENAYEGGATLVDNDLVIDYVD